MQFSLEKYTGLWYELLHYPSFFQSNDTYNTTAQYTLRKDGKLDVLNTTYVNGQKVTSHGVAERVGRVTEFRVSFDAPDVAKFNKKKKEVDEDKSEPNYVIKTIWFDEDATEELYKFVVVSDRKLGSLWVLSRVSNPKRVEYEKILAYVLKRFDRQKLVATPHYNDGEL